MLPLLIGNSDMNFDAFAFGGEASGSYDVSGKDRTVAKGPFPNINELAAGYWIWRVKDLDEAIEWVKRCPNPMPGPSVIEIREMFEMGDFDEAK